MALDSRWYNSTGAQTSPREESFPPHYRYLFTFSVADSALS